MADEILTENDVRNLLMTVGASSAAAGGDLSRSFAELNLDSLARIEIASRVREQCGVDVEDDLTAQETPDGLRQLVNRRHSGTRQDSTP